MPRSGAWATEGNDDYSSPHPCKACETRKGGTRYLLLSIFLNSIIIIMLITILWQNLDGREGRAYTPYGSGVPRRTP